MNICNEKEKFQFDTLKMLYIVMQQATCTAVNQESGTGNKCSLFPI